MSVGTECRCNECGESFVLSGDEEIQVVHGEMQYEHYTRFGPNEAGEFDTECGGYGPIIGSWS